jgi:hypothetical protein
MRRAPCSGSRARLGVRAARSPPPRGQGRGPLRVCCPWNASSLYCVVTRRIARRSVVRFPARRGCLGRCCTGAVKAGTSFASRAGGADDYLGRCCPAQAGTACCPVQARLSCRPGSPPASFGTPTFPLPAKHPSSPTRPPKPPSTNRPPPRPEHHRS